MMGKKVEKAAEAAAAVEVATPNEMTMISLKDICAELDIKPAAARRKLRSKLEKSAGDFRWEFTIEQADEIKELLTAKPAANEEAAEAKAA